LAGSTMRGFLAKIFVCMLMVPVLSRGGGILLQEWLGDPRPQGERTLDALLPVTADFAASALAHDGADKVEARLQRTGGLMRLLPPETHCIDRREGAVAAPVPGASGTCLGAMPPPRPLVLGVIPSSLWYLLPILELLCCGFVSYFLARYLAAPILRTQQAAAAFAAGDLAARAWPPAERRRHDEAADLEQEFNRMADRVAAMITTQQRFIGDVSHEIRSPLGRLAMSLGLARREASPELLPRLDRMEQELDGVSRLVKELLALASLQGNVRPAHTELIDLRELLSGAIDDLAFEFHDSPQTVRAPRQGGAPVLVRGDAALLRRAVDNVLRNALFYTPDDAVVETLVETDGNWGRLVVRDHGPGVPEAALPHLFEPFFRVDQARARNTGGVGLGLAISRRAVELHGGRMRAANMQPHGLAVRIELPVAAED
ncbi:MAG TPA: HAMP domain-containing sensor histidine kinase, partial [Acetobacteraceae bacterium]|nr:HAMP domain-containing sensor histidine kinase [Acetobacteraceae bacterium]